MMGMKSAAVREILPRATEEAVHRDYLVSTERLVPCRAMATAVSSVADICRAAKRAARALARARHRASRTPRSRRSRAALDERAARRSSRPTSATCRPAREAEIGDALLDRLRLDEARIARDRAARCARSPRWPTRSAR